MSRTEIYRDMEATLGLVPTFLKSVPDSTLEEEWSIFKKLQLAETVIPNKYKELIGLALSAVTKCRYCVLFHTEVAKLAGATDAEIEEAVHYAQDQRRMEHLSKRAADRLRFVRGRGEACVRLCPQQGNREAGDLGKTHLPWELST